MTHRDINLILTPEKDIPFMLLDKRNRMAEEAIKNLPTHEPSDRIKRNDNIPFRYYSYTEDVVSNMNKGW